MAKRHRISLLIDLDPERAKRELLAALQSSWWSAREAAEKLGADWGSVKRWIVRLGLRGTVDEARVRAGLHPLGGRPKGARSRGGRDVRAKGSARKR